MDWTPAVFFAASKPFALLILNQPINETALAVLTSTACFTVCADGGANRYYDYMHGSSRSRSSSRSLPNAIVGDLDSIRPSVRRYYERRGVAVVEDPDQNSTDFTKSLTYLDAHAEEITAAAAAAAAAAPLDIVVLGGLGGRVDQAFSQIHHLCAMSMRTLFETDSSSSSSSRPRHPLGNVYLVSEECISFVLQPGRNTIHTTRPDAAGEGSSSSLGENVGLIPLTGPATISTAGLQWDVRDWTTQIGSRISTSNHIRADVVVVETDAPVLFAAELAGRFKQ